VATSAYGSRGGKKPTKKPSSSSSRAGKSSKQELGWDGGDLAGGGGGSVSRPQTVHFDSRANSRGSPSRAGLGGESGKREDDAKSRLRVSDAEEFAPIEDEDDGPRRVIPVKLADDDEDIVDES